MIAVGIILLFLVLYWDVYSDAKKVKVNHKKEAWIRAVLLIPSFLCFYLPVNKDLWLMITRLFVTMFMMQSWWWEFFDGWLNLKRGHSWRFNGSDDADDAASDNFLQGKTPFEQILIKWGMIILFTTLYILTIV